MDIRYHVMIDPSGLVQEIINDYDADKIAAAAAAGFTFAAVDADGVAIPVEPEEVVSPWTEQTYTMVAPEYVDVRMDATLDVLEIMAEALETTESGGIVALSAKSVSTGLEEAMARLRAVVRKDESDADS